MYLLVLSICMLLLGSFMIFAYSLKSSIPETRVEYEYKTLSSDQMLRQHYNSSGVPYGII